MTKVENTAVPLGRSTVTQLALFPSPGKGSTPFVLVPSRRISIRKFVTPPLIYVLCQLIQRLSTTRGEIAFIMQANACSYQAIYEDLRQVEQIIKVNN